jgi:hypothetical protein
MSETPKPQDKEAFNAFVAKYNLEPANNDAIMNCLFELNEKIDAVAKHTTVYAKEDDFFIAGMKHT